MDAARPVRIVLIEDNPADVLLVQMALKEKGISGTVTYFTNGVEAVETMCDRKFNRVRAPDVILIDLNLPGPDGFETLRMLRESPRLAGISTAILTSSCSTSDRERSALNGVRHVVKPSDLGEFLSTVGQIVEEMLAR